MPEFLISKYPIPFYLGGTSILIVVVVAMDTVTQVQTRLMSSQYESLIRKTKIWQIINSMNLVIFGPPGAGKGTQSKFIVKKFNLFQLSTGEILRNEIEKKTELGNEISSIINSGKLVSDNIVSNLIEKYVLMKNLKIN